MTSSTSPLAPLSYSSSVCGSSLFHDALAFAAAAFAAAAAAELVVDMIVEVADADELSLDEEDRLAWLLLGTGIPDAEEAPNELRGT